MRHLTLLLLLLVLISCGRALTNLEGQGGAGGQREEGGAGGGGEEDSEAQWRLLSGDVDGPKGTKWWGRYGHQVVVKDGVFYLFGGYDSSSKYKNDVWSSNDGIKWEEVRSSAGWTARRGHQVVVKDGVFYLFGGYDGYDGVSDRNTKNDVWKWSGDEGDDWQIVSAHVANPTKKWTGRVAHQVVLKGDYFYLFGGYDIFDSQKNDVWKWSGDEGDDWQVVSVHEANPTKKWTARSGHQVVVKDGSFYLFGGLDSASKDDVWKWSGDEGDDWQVVSVHEANPTKKWTARSGHQVVVKDGSFYLFGGTGPNSYKNDVWSSSDGKSWTEVSVHAEDPKGTKWSSRYEHQVVLKGGEFFLFGGGRTGKKNNLKNDVWVYK